MLWGGSYCYKVPVKSEKQEGTKEVRQSSFSSPSKSQYCIYCQNRNVNILKSCGKWGVVKCCSNLCQQRHYKSHQKTCDAIFHLSNKMGQYQANLTPKEQKTLIGLLGTKML